MKTTVQDTVRNEKGFVLVLALLMLAIVTFVGIAATTTSETEVQISVNERDYATYFYSTEGALIDRLENSSAWLNTEFLTDDETSANDTGAVDLNSDGTDEATVEIRCIEGTGTPVEGLSDAANELPVRPHMGRPPPGSGYSMKSFEVRRYGLTATSATGNTQVQLGAWKVFNKTQ